MHTLMDMQTNRWMDEHKAFFTQLLTLHSEWSCLILWDGAASGSVVELLRSQESGRTLV